MTEKEIEQLAKYQEQGYEILIQTSYVDGFTSNIYKDDDGLWCFDSDVYSREPLHTIDGSQVRVFKEVKGW